MRYIAIILTGIVLGTITFFIINNFKFEAFQTKNATPTPSPINPVIEGNTHELSTIKSNKWYSTIYNDFPTQPLYTMPLAFKLSNKGIGFSYPQIKYSEKTVFAPYTEDFTVGLDNVTLQKPELTSVGDWSITTSMKGKNNERMDFYLGRGIPYTTIQSYTNDVIFNFTDKFTSEPVENAQNTYVITIKEHIYLVSSKVKPQLNPDQKTILIPESTSVFIALLDKKENAPLFANIAHIYIQNTEADFELTDESVNTIYSVTADNIKTPIVALYPHQTDFLTITPQAIGQYETLRGPLRILQTGQFTTSYPLLTPPETFEELNSSSTFIPILQDGIEEYLDETQPESTNYFLGTWLGEGISLIQLADVHGLDEEKEQLIKYITPIYTKALADYTYDNELTSFKSLKPEFGNEKLNDHHFHYSYFIRAAAVLMKEDPRLIESVKPAIEDMVGDIATIDKKSTKFPYLRNFDIYEGHSWADGYGAAADGNNQESTSEAINAWYSVYVWALANNDKELQNTALALYNTEIMGAKYYWWDIKGLYKEPYEHQMASIVWGGKVDFSTWFSAEANMIYGIQLLPFTPASDYLGTLEEFNTYYTDLTQSGGSVNEEWGDLIVMWMSYSNPTRARSLAGQIDTFEGSKSRAIFEYIIRKNNE